MTYLFPEQSFAEEVFQEYERASNETLSNVAAAVEALCKLQARVREERVRRAYYRVRNAVIVIQKNYRRYRTVREVSRLFEASLHLRRRELYHRQATIIQAAFRGYMIRKYVASIAERRQYLAAVAAVSARTAEAAREYRRSCEEEEERAALEEKRKNIPELSGLHHLVSTKAIPGIYNPGYPVLPPTIDGTPVDAVIAQQAKAEVQKTTMRVTAPKVTPLTSTLMAKSVMNASRYGPQSAHSTVQEGTRGGAPAGQVQPGKQGPQSPALAVLRTTGFVEPPALPAPLSGIGQRSGEAPATALVSREYLEEFLQ